MTLGVPTSPARAGLTRLFATALLASMCLVGCNGGATPINETDASQAAPGAGMATGETHDMPVGAAEDVGPSMGTVTSEAGLYRVSYHANLEPVVANALHTWSLTVADRQGEPVQGASIAVTGGMPGHSHGLPTEPGVVPGDGRGEYVVEGMRFQMSGPWTVSLEIDAAPGADTVIIPLEVGNPES